MNSLLVVCLFLQWGEQRKKQIRKIQHTTINKMNNMLFFFHSQNCSPREQKKIIHIFGKYRFEWEILQVTSSAQWTSMHTHDGERKRANTQTFQRLDQFKAFSHTINHVFFVREHSFNLIKFKSIFGTLFHGPQFVFTKKKKNNKIKRIIKKVQRFVILCWWRSKKEGGDTLTYWHKWFETILRWIQRQISY